MQRIFTKSLYELFVRQDISLSQSLLIMSRKPLHDGVSRAAEALYKALENGSLFSNALRTCAAISFDDVYISFILLAESAAGLLETVRSRCVTLHRFGEDAAVSPEARELAERYLTYAAAGASISLLSFANENADRSNAEMAEFVTAAQMLLADMLCGRLPDMKLPRAEMLRLTELMRTAETYLRFNVSTKHVLGLLAVDTVRQGAQ